MPHIISRQISRVLWNVSHINETWLIRETWLIQWDMTHSWYTTDSMRHDSVVSYPWHDSFNETWLIQWDMTHSMRHDSFNETWLIQWDMTHWMSHDSFNETWLIQWDMTHSSHINETWLNVSYINETWLIHVTTKWGLHRHTSHIFHHKDLFLYLHKLWLCKVFIQSVAWLIYYTYISHATDYIQTLYNLWQIIYRLYTICDTI